MNVGKLRDELAVFDDDSEVSLITELGADEVVGFQQDLNGAVAIIGHTGAMRLHDIAEREGL